jgi:hypothetical protein
MAYLLASLVETALEILERNRRLLPSKNPWVWAALWPASFRRLGLLTMLAEAAGATVPSIRNAASTMKIWGVEKMKQ